MWEIISRPDVRVDEDEDVSQHDPADEGYGADVARLQVPDERGSTEQDGEEGEHCHSQRDRRASMGVRRLHRSEHGGRVVSHLIDDGVV